ncbi:MAG: ABC transporter permease, partial [Acidimicrobiales bacterium]
MKWYALRRFGASVLTLFLASVVVFAGIRALPGGPAVALSSETSSPAVLAAIRQQYGLNKPLPVQYWDWITQILQGNMGTSPKTGLPVSSVLAQRIP